MSFYKNIGIPGTELKIKHQHYDLKERGWWRDPFGKTIAFYVDTVKKRDRDAVYPKDVNGLATAPQCVHCAFLEYCGRDENIWPDCGDLNITFRKI